MIRIGSQSCNVLPGAYAREFAELDAHRSQHYRFVRWGNAMPRLRSLIAVFVVAVFVGWSGTSQAQTDAQIKKVIEAYIGSLLPSGSPAGAEIVVHASNGTFTYHFGYADHAKNIAMSKDAIADLASTSKLFTALELGDAVDAHVVTLSDPVDKYLTQLKSGRTITRVTLGMLASHSSGLPDRPGAQPWHPSTVYDKAAFLKFLVRWRGKPCPHTGQCTEGEPGKQYIYSDAGFILLRMAMETALETSFGDELGKMTTALGMAHTTLDVPKDKSNLVQGYTAAGKAVPLSQVESAGVFKWPGTGQVFSSGTDMAVMAQLALGDLTGQTVWQPAMLESQMPIFVAGPKLTLGMAWQSITQGGVHILDKNGALPFTSTYIGAVPDKNLAMVILINQGNAPAEGNGRAMLQQLAGEAAAK
jgi:CubicO group peptidase (beta-lactamase class C family)